MSELWFYTNEGKQMDPVPIGDLKRLAREGKLKPTDMVWKDGMPAWKRAGAVKELFGEPAAANPVHDSGGANVDPDSARVSRRRRPTDDDDEFNSGRRRPPMKSGGSGFGIIAALVVGVLLLLGSLGVGVAILIFSNKTPPEGKINQANVIRGEEKYNLVLAPNGRDSRTFSFRKGVDYEITVTTKPELQELDVDLHIFNAQGREVISDTDPDRDCHLRWIPDADGEYRVEIHNLNQFGRAVQVNCAVVIREFKEPIAEEKKEPIKDPPLPADVLEGSGFKSDFKFSPSRKEEMQKFRVKAGHKAVFTFVPTNPKTDFNMIVVKDSDPNQVLGQDMGPEARASVSFSLPKTEIVQVRIVNATGKSAGAGAYKGTLSYDASP